MTNKNFSPRINTDSHGYFSRFTRLLLLASVCIGVHPWLNCSAQPTDSGSFFQSVASYFTSFNTNLDTTFGEHKGSAWAGIASIQNAGVPLANEVGFNYAIGKKALALEAVIRDSGVSGTIVSLAGGFSLNKIVHDVKLSLYLDGGYNTTSDVRTDKPFGEVGVRAVKALTEHTYSGIGMGYQFPGNRRIFTVFAGFTF